MENRLRLGQFVTQRQGATYTDVWVDGFAFKDLYRCACACLTVAPSSEYRTLQCFYCTTQESTCCLSHSPLR